jgi:hypothetical protein
MFYIIGVIVCVWIFVRYVLPYIIGLVTGAFQLIGAFKARIGNEDFWAIVWV